MPINVSLDFPSVLNLAQLITLLTLEKDTCQCIKIQDLDKSKSVICYNKLNFLKLLGGCLFEWLKPKKLSF